MHAAAVHGQPMAVSSTDSQQRIWHVTNLGWFLPGRLPSPSVIETPGFKTCLYVPSFREDVLRRGTLTPSSRRLRRRHRHLLCRRRPRRLLPRLALVEGSHRQLPTNQKGLSRGILDVFCSHPTSFAPSPLARPPANAPQKAALLCLRMFNTELSVSRLLDLAHQ